MKHKQSKVQSTFKSNDTEEWLDKVWTRPIGYLWAKFFQRLDFHPNTVTILSMIIGAVSALFFASASYHYEGSHGLLMNIIAILLLAWANFYDSADGQLARMTGKKSRLGRFLDGAASEVWFIPIYLALVYRFYQYHDLEFQFLGIDNSVRNTLVATALLFVLVLFSGFFCHSRQCGLADYYRQIHLFFLKGEAGSELDNSAQQRAIDAQLSWKEQPLLKFFQKNYVNYTLTQERETPCFQQLRAYLETKYGGLDKVPTSFRETFRKYSLPLMKFTNILTFNTRAVVLYAVCLLDVPSLYFLFEVIVMSALCLYMRHRHEQLCLRLMNEHPFGSYPKK